MDNLELIVNCCNDCTETIHFVGCWEQRDSMARAILADMFEEGYADEDINSWTVEFQGWDGSV